MQQWSLTMFPRIRLKTVSIGASTLASQCSTYVVFIIRTVLSSWPSPSVSGRLICNANSWQWQLWLWWRDIVSHDCWPPTLGLIHFTAVTVPINYSIWMTPSFIIYFFKGFIFVQCKFCTEVIATGHGLCLLVFISNSIYLSFKNIT